MLPTVADIRAEIARRQIRKYTLAASVHVHPGRFSAMLTGRIEMPPAVRERVIEALSACEQEVAAAG